MNEENEGAVRLWQAVAIQALLDGSLANPSKQHRIEARLFVEGSTFSALCSQVHLDANTLRRRMDDPDLFHRLRELTGGRVRGEAPYAA